MANPAGRSSRTDESVDEESPLEEIAAGITIGLILTVAFGLLALGIPWFWIAFPVGFAGVLPVVMGLVKLYERRRARSGRRSETSTIDAEDALETLRERYARGELTDEQFERRLDRLLETETLEDVERRSRARGDRDRDRGRDRERERDSTVELEES